MTTGQFWLANLDQMSVGAAHVTADLAYSTG
jgi:hypothetical protein